MIALCAALAGRDDEPTRGLLASERIDWPALRTAADRHGLTGYLSARLQAPRWRQVVPDAFLSHARRVYLMQWVRNGQLLREMTRIAGRFEAAGVSFLFFKGPLLAAALYDRQLGSRTSHDIDVLIPRAGDIARVESALAPLGYRRRSRLVLPLALSRHALCQLEYRSDGFVVEPHWGLQSHPSLRLDTKDLWDQSVVRTGPGGGRLPALSNEYTLLANILSIPADLQNASLKLRTFLELHLLHRRCADSDDGAAFWERRRRERTQRLTAVALAVAADLFGGDDDSPLPPLSTETRDLAVQLRTQVLGLEAGEWRRRRVAFRLFEASPALSIAWWAMTLPARAMAHPDVTSRRLRWR